MLRSQSADLLSIEIYGYIGRQLEQQQQQQLQQQQQQYKQNISIGHNNFITHTPTQSFFIGSPSSGGSSASGGIGSGTKKMVKQLSNASQQSSSSTSSSVQSAPPHINTANADKGQSPGRWSSNEHYLSTLQHVLPIHHEQQCKSIQQYKQQWQQQSNIAGDAHSMPLQLQSISTPTTTATTNTNNTLGGTNNNDNESIGATSESAASITSSYSDTTVEDRRIGENDNVSLTGSVKKRKRRLRFPFGRRKSGSAGNESVNSVKSKLA